MIFLQKKTILVFCEGPEDKAFIKYLHNLFNDRKSDPVIIIRQGRGGTANGIVKDAHKEPGEFNFKIVVLDNDKSETEMRIARDYAEQVNIKLIEHTPCIEMLLLKIKSNKQVKSSYKSGKCKKIFNNTYFISKDRTEWNDYRDVFPKAFLKTNIKLIPELKKLYFLVKGRIRSIFF